MTTLSKYFSDTSLTIWLSLFPFTYLLHIAEEYWGGNGYSAYLFENHGVELSPPRFLVLQSLGLLLMLVGILLASNLGFPQRMLVILSSVILVNGLIHTSRSIKGGFYEPGLITSIVLWIPLGFATLTIIWDHMPRGRFLLAALIGVGISALVEVIAMKGGRLIN